MSQKPADTLSSAGQLAIARERVDVLSTRNAEPDWLKKSRLAAWEAYLQTPMPTARDEEWRRTEIDALDLSRLVPVEAAKTQTNETEKNGVLPAWVESASRHIENIQAVVMQSSTSSFQTKLNAEVEGKGVVLSSLETAFEKHADLIKPYFDQSKLQLSEGKFALMNKALFNCGAFLYVPKNVELKEPIFIVINLNGDQLSGGHPAAIFPRIVVNAEANSKVSVVTVLTSESHSGGMSLVNAIVEVHTGQNAQVNFVEIDNYDSNIFAVTKNDHHVDRDGKLSSITACLGGAHVKTDIVTWLEAPGANSDVLGVILGDANEQFNFNTVQEHASNDTTSNINFRVALKDQAASVYQGIIRVAKVAQRTDAFQSNKNLLLGTQARADSIPKLEILADDVKCSHGATVGPVDRDQIFYLMSRGLTRTEAEELVVNGFFRQIVEAAPIVGIGEWISELVAAKIKSPTD